MAFVSRSSRGPPNALMLPDMTTIFEWMAFVDGDYPRFDTGTPYLEKSCYCNNSNMGLYMDRHAPEPDEAFLQRSKSTPLYLWTCGFASNFQTVSMVLDSHASRLVEAEIMGFEPTWFDSLFAMPTTQLKAITLSSRIEPEELGEWNDEERYLWVEHATYTVNLDRISPTEILCTLQGMPRLCSLNIGYALEPCLPLDHPVAVTLPVLSDVQVRVEYMLDLRILQRMTLPSVKRIALSRDEIGEYEDIAVITPHIHALLPPHDPSRSQITLMAKASHHEGRPESRTTVKLNAQPTDKPLVDLDPLYAFRPLLGPVSSLYFDGYAEVQKGEDPFFIAPSFCAMTEVRELRISDLSDITFVLDSRAHDTPETPSEDDASMTCALPNLKRISLFPERDPTNTKESVVRVRKILSERKTRGVAVDILEVVFKHGWRTISKTKIAQQDLEPLSEVVQVVFLDKAHDNDYDHHFLSFI
ncbi:hypothetical protein BDN71DRAFT_1425984 [Pleurotus eryngii]|uniref:Uncharacterized protein n=1 Tax=Pleurotus eryngii TaxID=5323 RepID=A0A9P6A9A2_PLEER|nr:hypothetical protein BDN71DRAFT_1425984 [Pleurotus eryngii]